MPTQRKKNAFSLISFPSAVLSLQRALRNPSPFEDVPLTWEVCDGMVSVEWIATPIQSLRSALRNPSFDLKRRLLYGQDFLDHCLLTGDRPTGWEEAKYSLDENFRLRISLPQITGLGFSIHETIDFRHLRPEWEDPIRLGDAYSPAALLARVLKKTPFEENSQKAFEQMQQHTADYLNKKATQVFEPIAELSSELNGILASALNPDPAARITHFQDFRRLYMAASQAMLMSLEQ